MGFDERAGHPVSRLEIGGPSPEFIASLGCEFEVRTFGSSPRVFTTQLLFVPPAAAPVIVWHSGSLQCLEAELTPWAAAVITGTFPRDWPREATPLYEMSPDIAMEVESDLIGIRRFPERFDALDRYFGARIQSELRSTPGELRWAWNELATRGGNVAIRDLALQVGWSRRHFITRFRDCIGLAPKESARSWRFQRARNLLAKDTASIAEVASAVGYSDQSHLTREFRELGRCTPAAFRSIRFANLPGIPAEAAGF